MFNPKADLEIFRPDSSVSGKDIRVGSAKHRTMSSTLDVEIGTQHVEFRAMENSALPKSSSRAYESPRPKIGWVTWEDVGRSSDIVQMMETKESKKIVLAQLEKVSWARSKVARLQIYGNPSQAMLDEIVITVTAMSASGHGRGSHGQSKSGAGKLAPAGATTASM